MAGQGDGVWRCAAVGHRPSFWKAIRVIALTCLMVPATSAGPYAAAPSVDHGNKFGSSPHSTQECISCHTNAPNDDQALPEGLGAVHESRCVSCHRGAATASHPIGFIPENALPLDFPLGVGGLMTCATCHDLHGSERGLLRKAERGRAFCLSCHDTEFFDEMADHGQSLFISGHLDSNAEGAREIDSYSLRCLVCHTEKVPARSQFASLSEAPAFGPDQTNHPIGARYDEAVRFGGYRPVFTLASEILLPNGRVSCVSCHAPYSRKHARTLAPSGGLCRECHAL